MIETEKGLFLMSAAKLSEIAFQARRLLRYAPQHRCNVRLTDIQRFGGLEESVTPAVVGARLQLSELFDYCKPRHGTDHRLLHCRGSARLSHSVMRDLQ